MLLSFWLSYAVGLGHHHWHDDAGGANGQYQLQRAATAEQRDKERGAYHTVYQSFNVNRRSEGERERVLERTVAMLNIYIVNRSKVNSHSLPGMFFLFFSFFFVLLRSPCATCAGASANIPIHFYTVSNTQPISQLFVPLSYS